MQETRFDFSGLSVAKIAEAVTERDDRLWNESYLDKSGMFRAQQKASGQIA